MNEILQPLLEIPYIKKIAIAAAGLIVIKFIFRSIQRIVATRVHSKEFRYGIRRGLTIVEYIALALLFVGAFSNQLANITVVLGVVGAGVAFALQEVIVSIAGWIALSFNQFYKIGDRVQLGGIKGDVIDIGVLRTTLMEIGEWVHADQYSGRIVRIANSFVFKEPVYNYSADFPFVWDEISIPVKYNSDHNLTRAIILEIANEITGDYAAFAQKHWTEMTRKYAIENAVVEPTVFLQATDNWLEFTLRYVVDYSKRRMTKDILYTRIIDAITRSEGKIKVASATLQLVDLPALDVNLTE